MNDEKYPEKPDDARDSLPSGGPPEDDVEQLASEEFDAADFLSDPPREGGDAWWTGPDEGGSEAGGEFESKGRAGDDRTPGEPDFGAPAAAGRRDDPGAGPPAETRPWEGMDIGPPVEERGGGMDVGPPVGSGGGMDVGPPIGSAGGMDVGAPVGPGGGIDVGPPSEHKPPRISRKRGPVIWVAAAVAVIGAAAAALMLLGPTRDRGGDQLAGSGPALPPTEPATAPDADPDPVAPNPGRVADAEPVASEAPTTTPEAVAEAPPAPDFEAERERLEAEFQAQLAAAEDEARRIREAAEEDRRARQQAELAAAEARRLLDELQSARPEEPAARPEEPPAAETIAQQLARLRDLIERSGDEGRVDHQLELAALLIDQAAATGGDDRQAEAETMLVEAIRVATAAREAAEQRSAEEPEPFMWALFRLGRALEDHNDLDAAYDVYNQGFELATDTRFRTRFRTGRSRVRARRDDSTGGADLRGRAFPGDPRRGGLGRALVLLAVPVLFTSSTGPGGQEDVDQGDVEELLSEIRQLEADLPESDESLRPSILYSLGLERRRLADRLARRGDAQAALEQYNRAIDDFGQGLSQIATRPAGSYEDLSGRLPRFFIDYLSRAYRERADVQGQQAAEAERRAAAATVAQARDRANRLAEAEGLWARFAYGVARLVGFDRPLPSDDDRWDRSRPATVEWINQLAGLIETRVDTPAPAPDTALATIDRRVLAQPHYVRGVNLFQEGRHDEAIASLGEAIRIYPYDARAYYFRGIALHLRSPSAQEAVADMQRGVALERQGRPSSRDVAASLSRVQYGLRNWVESFRRPLPRDSVFQASW